MQQISYLCIYCKYPFISSDRLTDRELVGRKWLSKIVCITADNKIWAGNYDIRGNIIADTSAADKKQILHKTSDNECLYHKHCYACAGSPKTFITASLRDKYRGNVIPRCDKKPALQIKLEGQLHKAEILDYLKNSINSDCFKFKLFQYGLDELLKKGIDLERHSKPDILTKLKDFEKSDIVKLLSDADISRILNDRELKNAT